MLPEKQSAYRRHHSTETAVLDVMSDILTAADSGQVTLLGLLDQSAAFDVVDHDVLTKRLEHSFGVAGHVLAWIRSYLAGRSQCVSFNGERSTVTPLICGLAQGSVLGPLYFLLYTAPILRIVEELGFNIHAYADDLQIFSHGDPLRSASMMSRFSNCVDVVKGWMASNRLRLNPSKTEVIWLGSRSCLQHCPRSPQLVSGALITPSLQVRNLGVIIDSELSMTAHVNNLVRVCSFHLRQLRLIRRSLDFDAAHALIRAFIHSRLDYCNSVLTGVPDYSLRRLQAVLNSSARLLLQLPGRASVSIPMRNELHWLRLPDRITYKLCLLTFKSLHGHAPVYLTRHCVRVSSEAGRARLRSASSGQLIVPRTPERTFGDRAFACSGPISWNSLPPSLRDDCLSLISFKKLLKTVLF